MLVQIGWNLFVWIPKTLLIGTWKIFIQNNFNYFARITTKRQQRAVIHDFVFFSVPGWQQTTWTDELAEVVIIIKLHTWRPTTELNPSVSFFCCARLFGVCAIIVHCEARGVVNFYAVLQKYNKYSNLILYMAGFSGAIFCQSVPAAVHIFSQFCFNVLL